MAYYARYIDIDDGSYKICNPYTTDTERDIVCNEAREEEEEPVCSDNAYWSGRSTSARSSDIIRLGHTYLYTDYTIPPEVQCGRNTIGSSNASSYSWNPWSYGNYGCHYSWGYYNYWNGCNATCSGSYYYNRYWNTIENQAFSGYGYSYCYTPMKCSEVPGELYNEFSRIKNCSTRRCVNVGSTYWYSGYGYGYGSSLVCDALNGRIRERECVSEDCGADDDCMLHAQLVTKTYEVDYEIVRGAYYCLEDFEVPESGCSLGIYKGNLFTSFAQCKVTPDGSAICENTNANSIIESCKEEPDEGIGNGWTLVALGHPEPRYGYFKDTDCDDDPACSTCIKCDETDTDCRHTGYSNYGGYYYNYSWQGPFYVLGSNCCTSSYHGYYYGYYWGWSNGICPSDDGPNMKFVLVNGSCQAMSNDAETPAGGRNYGTDRRACFAAEDPFNSTCHAIYRNYTVADECEATPPPPPADPPDDYEPPPPFVGDCEVAGPSFTREIASQPPSNSSNFHECIPNSGGGEAPPETTTKRYVSKYPKQTPLTKYTFTHAQAVYTYDLPSDLCDLAYCNHHWYYNNQISLTQDPCDNSNRPPQPHDANCCTTTELLLLKMKYVPEEIIKEVTAVAVVKYCERHRQNCDYVPPDDDDDEDGSD